MDHHNQPLNEIIDFLIIGGGVAGLSVANRLVDLDEKPVLIEALDYPSHKVCGEFISPEALPYLEDWGIFPECSINQIKIYSDSCNLDFPFPVEAAGMSRFQLDTRLAERAKKNGALILSNTRILELKPIKTNSETLYIATLSNGQNIRARNVFLGGGRFFKTDQKAPELPYFGFKAHFTGIEIPETLEMHLSKGAYLGISPVGKGVVNVACLTKVDNKITHPEHYIDELLRRPSFARIKEKLSSGQMLFKNWLSTPAPVFEAKPNPVLENVYFIGDAAGSIPPATGNGLGMAITCGYMAADYAVLQDSIGFQKAWKRRYQSRIKRGQILHHVMMKPPLAKISLFICKQAPIIPKIIFSLTREK